jgi:hypothetical protein
MNRRIILAASQGRAVDLLCRVEENQPAYDGEKGQEELAGDWEGERCYEEGGYERLDHGARTGRAYDAQTEDAQHGETKVLEVVQRPLVLPQGADGVSRREGGLEGEDVGGGRLADAQPLARRSPFAADLVGDEDAQVGDGARKARRVWHARYVVSAVEGERVPHCGRRVEGVVGAPTAWKAEASADPRFEEWREGVASNGARRGDVR